MFPRRNIPVFSIFAALLELYLILVQPVPLWAFPSFNTQSVLMFDLVFSIMSLLGGAVSEYLSVIHETTLEAVSIGFYGLSLMPLAFIGIMTPFMSTATFLGFVDAAIFAEMLWASYRLGKSRAK